MVEIKAHSYITYTGYIIRYSTIKDATEFLAGFYLEKSKPKKEPKNSNSSNVLGGFDGVAARTVPRAYMLAAVRKECDIVRAARVGSRTYTVLKAASILGRFVNCREYVMQELAKAAGEMQEPLPPDQVYDLICTGIRNSRSNKVKVIKTERERAEEQYIKEFG